MAKKPMKIKRYHGYLGQRRSPVVTFFLMLVWAVVVATMVVIGIAIYEPVMNYISQRREDSSQGISSQPESSSSQESVESSSQPEELEEVQQQMLRSVYLAHSVLTDPVKRDEFLNNAVKNGANAVVVDIKNENGAVLHRSNVKTASTALAISDTAVDLGETVEAIVQKGLRPVARVYAFEDSVASASLRRMACFYQNANLLWYDNDPSNGGRPWLNPYSQEAQEYVLQLAVESGELGFEEVILAGFHFPRGYQLDNIYFGENIPENGKAAVLEDIAGRVQERLEAMGVGMSVMIRALDILEPNGFTYGEGNPLDRFQCTVYIDFTPAYLFNTFNNQYLFGGAALESGTAPQAVVKAAAGAVVPMLDKTRLERGGYRAAFSCDTETGQLTAEEILQTAEDLTAGGMTDIFFSSAFSAYPDKADYGAGLKK